MAKYAYSDTDYHLDKLEDYINYYKNKSITYYKGYMDVDYSFHITDLFDNFFNTENYNNIIEFKISDVDLIDFQYNPKGLSNYIYGTPDLWFIILKANQLDHAGEMDFLNGKLYLPDPEALNTYLSTVYSLKNNYISKIGHMW